MNMRDVNIWCPISSLPQNEIDVGNGLILWSEKYQEHVEGLYDTKDGFMKYTPPDPPDCLDGEWSSIQNDITHWMVVQPPATSVLWKKWDQEDAA